MTGLAYGLAHVESSAPPDLVTGVVSLVLVAILVGIVGFSLFSLINTLVEVTLYFVIGGGIIAALFYFIDPLSLDKGIEFAQYVLRSLGGG